MARKRSNAAPAGTEAALERNERWKGAVRDRLLDDAVAALPGGVFCRFNLLAAPAAKAAYETPDGVPLPVRGDHDFGQCRALCALHQRDHLGFLIAARLRGVLLRRAGICLGTVGAFPGFRRTLLRAGMLAGTFLNTRQNQGGWILRFRNRARRSPTPKSRGEGEDSLPFRRLDTPPPDSSE
jgi:hypothetical protein